MPLLSAPPFAFSKKIRSFNYDAENQVLTFYFTSDIVRIYCGVPENVYKKLSVSKDPDRYFADKIEGVYTVQ